MNETTKKRPKGAQEYKGNGSHQWENVTNLYSGDTWRLRVPGGWLYRFQPNYGNPTMSFVPVPNAVGYAV
jgi:hypothetical protein